MKNAFFSTMAVMVFGGATLCGCSSATQDAQVAKQSSAQAAFISTSAGASKEALPRDPKIDSYVAAMRTDLSDGKVRTINSVMKLSADEAKVFWPIYSEYESELFDLGDQRVNWIRRFAAVQKSGVIPPTEATSLAEGYFKFEQQQMELKRKYFDIIASELSPVRGAQFIQIEHRVGTIVDLAIASELPLIKASSTLP